MGKKKSDQNSPKASPILAAVDFSPASEAALAWAARDAKLRHAPLKILHVVHDPESAPGYYVRSRRKGHLRRFEEVAWEMMDEFLDRVRRARPELSAVQDFEAVILIGLPTTRILDLARELDVQLIVMGSRGRTGLPHVLLGSKAERVVQLAPMPVTIVKADAPASEAALPEAVDVHSGGGNP